MSAKGTWLTLCVYKAGVGSVAGLQVVNKHSKKNASLKSQAPYALQAHAMWERNPTG